jgi:hypothetical protein
VEVARQVLKANGFDCERAAAADHSA